MEACGLVVEYNPFHYGHLHHLTSAKRIANADCMIAVMSGNFLQRGEPAIIDKMHRTRAALASGVDIIIELPYSYAVQNSTLFAEGAVKSLHQMGVSSICFGSESGTIQPFLHASTYIKQHTSAYEQELHSFLNKGDAFPTASSKAYEKIGLHQINLSQPNNILGLSYVQAIIDNDLPIEPLTTKRIANHYHDEDISTSIASATSIRKELLHAELSSKVEDTIPVPTRNALVNYKEKSSLWHQWEYYFPFLQYQVMAKTTTELQLIHGVDEGLENRIKQTCLQATSFDHWIKLMKTKRYTQTRLQRMFVHILTNTTKQAIDECHALATVPYIRLLGLSHTGRDYLHQQKKHIDIPILTNLNRKNQTLLAMDEKATNIYYHILPTEQRNKLRKQEFELPIMTF